RGADTLRQLAVMAGDDDLFGHGLGEGRHGGQEGGAGQQASQFGRQGRDGHVRLLSRAAPLRSLRVSEGITPLERGCSLRWGAIPDSSESCGSARTAASLARRE